MSPDPKCDFRGFGSARIVAMPADDDDDGDADWQRRPGSGDRKIRILKRYGGEKSLGEPFAALGLL